MTYFYLAYEFFKTGLFAIGGGLATIPFLAQIADHYPWFNREMLANMIAISESTPGAIGINMATYAGFHAKQVLGGVLATLALITPSIIIIIIVSKFLERFQTNEKVQGIFYGLRPAATGLIGASVLEVLKTSVITVEPFLASHNPLHLVDWKCGILFAILMYFIMNHKRHPIFYISIAAVIGIVFGF